MQCLVKRTLLFKNKMNNTVCSSNFQRIFRACAVCAGISFFLSSQALCPIACGNDQSSNLNLEQESQQHPPAPLFFERAYRNMPVLSSSPDNLEELIETITQSCAEAYPLEYARRFIKSGGKTTNDQGIFGISREMDLIGFVFERTLTQGKKMIDLGSGDGRVVFLASLYGVDANGVEYDRALCAISEKSKERLAEKGVIEQERVHFICDDFFNLDLSSYDVFYLNPGFVRGKELAEKISREAREGSILIFYHFPNSFRLHMRNMEPLYFVRHGNSRRIIRVFRKNKAG